MCCACSGGGRRAGRAVRGRSRRRTPRISQARKSSSATRSRPAGETCEVQGRTGAVGVSTVRGRPAVPFEPPVPPAAPEPTALPQSQAAQVPKKCRSRWAAAGRPARVRSGRQHGPGQARAGRRTGRSRGRGPAPTPSPAGPAGRSRPVRGRRREHRVRVADGAQRRSPPPRPVRRAGPPPRPGREPPVATVTRSTPGRRRAAAGPVRGRRSPRADPGRRPAARP